MTVRPFRQLAIRRGGPLVLTQVFRPGIHQERFHVAVWSLEVPKNPPPVRPVTPPHASILMHRLDKWSHLFAVYEIFHRHQNWAGIPVRILFQDGRQPPVNPGREVDAHLWQLEEQPERRGHDRPRSGP